MEKGKKEYNSSEVSNALPYMKEWEQESDEQYTPQQMEFAFMTLHNAEDA